MKKKPEFQWDYSYFKWQNIPVAVSPGNGSKRFRFRTDMDSRAQQRLD
jgi:hypothetical protein